MKLILDTHVLLWWLDDPKLLSKDAQHALSDPNNEVFVSSAVLWEIAIKRAWQTLRFSRLRSQPLDFSHYQLRESQWARYRCIIAIRMLIAQAIEESSYLVTRDASISRYSVSQILA